MKKNRFDVVTFGSASWDAFVKLKGAETVESEKFLNKGIRFNIGSKIDVHDLQFYSGGAGTNTAATFSNQGFKTAYAGAVGDDVYGREILKELKERKVTAFVKKSGKPTNFSIIFSYGNEDRTIFVYRGASETLQKKDIPFEKIKSSWFYISSTALVKDIVDYAFENKIRVALNPGNGQLRLPEMPEILKKTDILILNKEEASALTGISYKDEKAVFKKLDEICPGIAIMTKGAEGAIVSDGRNLYKAKSPEIEVVESTGAGDAFGSGFVSGFIQSNGNVEDAIQLAFANGLSCIQHVGAKSGLIKKGAPFQKVQILKNACCPECECQTK